MRLGRLTANAAVLATISLASLVAGYWAYRIVGSANQLAVQVPAALLTGTAGMVVWLRGFRRLHDLGPNRDYGLLFVLTFPACAVLLVVVHYVVRGYLTSFGNVAGAWFVLFAEQFVAMAIAAAGGRHHRTTVDAAAG